MSKIPSLCTAFLMTLLLQNSFSMEAVTELNEHPSPGTMQQQTSEAVLLTDLPLEINATIVKFLPLKNCLTLRHTAKFFSQFISFIQVPSKTENGLAEVLERLNPHTVSIIFSSNTFSEMRIMPKIRAFSFLNWITFINPIKSIAFRFNINSHCPVLPLCNIDSLQILKKDCEIAVPAKQFEYLLKEVSSSERIIEDIIFEKDPTRNTGFFQLLTSPQSVDLPNIIKIINSKGFYTYKVDRLGFIQREYTFNNLSPRDITEIEEIDLEFIFEEYKEGINSQLRIKLPCYSTTHNAVITPGMGPCTLIFPFDDK